MARDKYHDLVKQALIDEGWEITHDPLRIPKPSRPVEIDLGAEKMIGAKKDKEIIAVEIKSFLGKSEVYDFYNAMGQFDYYQIALEIHDPSRQLFLAVPDYIYRGLLQETISQAVLKKNNVNLIVYEVKSKRIIKWIK